MADQKRKIITLATPKLPFVWPKLNEPDYGNEKFPKPEGEYQVRLRGALSDPAVTAFLKLLEPHYKAALANAEEEFKKLKVDVRKKLGSVKPNDLFTTLYDKETEEPTGEIEFKFAMKASGEVKKGPRAGKKWTAKPAIFDAKGKALANPPTIWGGTIGKISFEIVEGGYFIPGTAAAGLSMKLKAVQLIELSNGSAKDAKGFGFGEEDGFEAGDDNTFADETGGTTEQASSDTDAGNEDF
jgi:hypothetical protein